MDALERREQLLEKHPELECCISTFYYDSDEDIDRCRPFKTHNFIFFDFFQRKIYEVFKNEDELFAFLKSNPSDLIQLILLDRKINIPETIKKDLDNVPRCAFSGLSIFNDEIRIRPMWRSDPNDLSKEDLSKIMWYATCDASFETYEAWEKKLDLIGIDVLPF